MSVDAKVRERLDKQRLDRQLLRRQRIDRDLSSLLEVVNMCSYARDVSSHPENGCLSFRYSGRRVQYWVGTHSLVVMNAIGTTVYKDTPPSDVVAMLQDHNVNNNFKVEPR